MGTLKEGTDIRRAAWAARSRRRQANAQDCLDRRRTSHWVIKDPHRPHPELIVSYQSIARMARRIAQIPDLRA